MHVRSNMRVTADDDVPPDIRRMVASRAESILQGTASGDYIEVTIRKRKSPSEIYAVHVGTPGDGYSQDFQPEDLDSERFDRWLRQQGKHMEANCWCGHKPGDHALPQCSSCAV